jgi:hypothetical protein
MALPEWFARAAWAIAVSAWPPRLPAEFLPGRISAQAARELCNIFGGVFAKIQAVVLKEPQCPMAKFGPRPPAVLVEKAQPIQVRNGKILDELE